LKEQITKLDEQINDKNNELKSTLETIGTLNSEISKIENKKDIKDSFSKAETLITDILGTKNTQTDETRVVAPKKFEDIEV
jgi:chromosome segregation ATPase